MWREPAVEAGDAAEDLAHRVQPELERGRHAEVAAGATKGPEQLAPTILSRDQQLTVGGHDIGTQQVVGGEAVLARQEAVTAAEREAGDADGRIGARDRRQAERRGDLDHVAPGRPPGRRARSGGPDRSSTERMPRRVDQQRVRRRLAERAVTGRAHRDRQAAAASFDDGAANVGGRRGLHDLRLGIALNRFHAA